MLRQVSFGLERLGTERTNVWPLLPGSVAQKMLGNGGLVGEGLVAFGTLRLVVLVVGPRHVDVETPLVFVLHVALGALVTAGLLLLLHHDSIRLADPGDGVLEGLVVVLADGAGGGHLVFNPLLLHPLGLVLGDPLAVSDDHALLGGQRNGGGQVLHEVLHEVGLKVKIVVVVGPIVVLGGDGARGRSGGSRGTSC